MYLYIYLYIYIYVYNKGAKEKVHILEKEKGVTQGKGPRVKYIFKHLKGIRPLLFISLY